VFCLNCWQLNGASAAADADADAPVDAEQMLQLLYAPPVARSCFSARLMAL
jgi:hypothetical protein